MFYGNEKTTYFRRRELTKMRINKSDLLKKKNYMLDQLEKYRLIKVNQISHLIIVKISIKSHIKLRISIYLHFYINNKKILFN